MANNASGVGLCASLNFGEATLNTEHEQNQETSRHTVPTTALLCDGLLFGGDCDVPEHVAKCPECGGTLHAENQEWDTDSGAPTLGGLVIYCNSDAFFSRHNSQYSDWIPVQNKCAEFFNAVDN